jgi:dephospho-CoA kinase
VGLTGGIGSGKSTVSARLAELGAVVIDADVLAREVVAAGTPGLAEIVAAFGPEMIGPDGELDRAAMGRRVFGDDEARARLEQIIHPRVRARAAEIEAAAGADAIVVHDIPLLVETGQADSFDVVLVVDAPPELQVQRIVEQRGMSEAEARARIAAQAGRDQRLAAADHVLSNDGSLAQLQAAVEQVWMDLLAHAARSKG